MAKRARISDAPGPAAVNRRTVVQGVAVVGAATLGSVLRIPFADAEIWEEGDIQCRPVIAEVAPDYINDETFAGFMKVSQALTGIEGLDTRIGSQYFERYARHPELTKLLPPLINTYREIGKQSPKPAEQISAIQERIINDKTTLGPAAEQLIYLWYISAFFLPAQHTAASRNWIYGTVEQYENSLLWKVINAHPPMTRGGSPGYWAYPPPSNEPRSA